VEQEGDHRFGFSPDQRRQINHLPPDGVLSKDSRARRLRGARAAEVREEGPHDGGVLHDGDDPPRGQRGHRGRLRGASTPCPG
jgi:hypothetical protein